MKKYIKLISVLILTPILVGFASCSSDGDSLGDFRVALATVNKIGDNTYDLTLDNGKKLWIAAPVGLNLKPEYDRAIINYTILSDKQGEYDHYIKLNAFYDVLTKGAIYIATDDEAKQDSIGNDPIRIHSAWEGGGYLNIHFGYNAGGIKSHMLNLVSAEPDLSVNKDVVELEFRHNKKDDPERYGVDGYVSFDLAPYKVEGRDKVTFKITAKDFNGETQTKEVVYEFDKESSEKPLGGETYNMTSVNIY